jgi:hypothetical protein
MGKFLLSYGNIPRKSFLLSSCIVFSALLPTPIMHLGGTTLGIFNQLNTFCSPVHFYKLSYFVCWIWFDFSPEFIFHSTVFFKIADTYCWLTLFREEKCNAARVFISIMPLQTVRPAACSRVSPISSITTTNCSTWHTSGLMRQYWSWL